MREQGGGTLFSPPIERKKVTVKVNGREEGNEGRRRLGSNGHGASYGGGKSMGNSSSSIPSGGGRLKGGSSIQSSGGGGRHQYNELLFEHSAAKEPSAEGDLGAKRKAAEEGVLPQWGHGKRSRCSRFEQSKHAVIPLEESATKSVPRAEKKDLVNGGSAVKLCAHGSSKLIGSKAIVRDGPVSRNGLINRTANALVHASSSIASDAVRQIGEAKDIASLQQKKVSANHGSCRQQQRSEGSELATTANGHGHCNGHVTATNIINGTCGTTVSSSDATPLACNYKPRVDLHALEWPRIILSLTRKEKEDDFLIFKGTKLPQRPKKRPKVVEKALHYCTPGNWLTDLSRGRYDVREKKTAKKKPRGLKAMESMESDSE